MKSILTILILLPAAALADNWYWVNHSKVTPAASPKEYCQPIDGAPEMMAVKYLGDFQVQNQGAIKRITSRGAVFLFVTTIPSCQEIAKAIILSRSQRM